MNKYQSNTRTFTARNVLETIITPPSDLTVANASMVPQLFDCGIYQFNADSFNENSNIILHGVGIFCNFADGLVWGDLASCLSLTIEAIPVSSAGAPIAGLVSTTVGSKAITGAGTNFPVDTPAGTYIQVDTGTSSQKAVYRVATAPGAGVATITDYARRTLAPGLANCRVITPYGVNPIVTGVADIRLLNNMFACERFLPVSTYAAIFGTAAPAILLRGSISLNMDMTLLTSVIDTSFAGKALNFDLVAEFEITSNGQLAS